MTTAVMSSRLGQRRFFCCLCCWRRAACSVRRSGTDDWPSEKVSESCGESGNVGRGVVGPRKGAAHPSKLPLPPVQFLSGAPKGPDRGTPGRGRCGYWLGGGAAGGWLGSIGCRRRVAPGRRLLGLLGVALLGVAAGLLGLLGLLGVALLGVAAGLRRLLGVALLGVAAGLLGVALLGVAAGLLGVALLGVAAGLLGVAAGRVPPATAG